MSGRNILYPRQVVPNLTVDLVGGGMWRVADQNPRNFSLVVFYRGLHCPICRKYLADLDSKIQAFGERGVEVIAVSMDDRERAEATKDDWGLSELILGYELTVGIAREWGLFLSTTRGKTSTGVVEPELFAEPGLFLVRPEQTLYFSSVQTMPFARPDFQGILGAVDWVLANEYPARGEVRDEDLLAWEVQAFAKGET